MLLTLFGLTLLALEPVTELFTRGKCTTYIKISTLDVQYSTYLSIYVYFDIP